MIKVENNDIYITRGDSCTLTLVIYDENGDVYEPVTGDAIYMTIKDDFDNIQYVAQFTDQHQFIIPSDITKKMAFGHYDYDVRLQNGSFTDTFIIEGNLTIGRGSNNA